MCQRWSISHSESGNIYTYASSFDGAWFYGVSKFFPIKSRKFTAVSRLKHLPRSYSTGYKGLSLANIRDIRRAKSMKTIEKYISRVKYQGRDIPRVKKKDSLSSRGLRFSNRPWENPLAWKGFLSRKKIMIISSILGSKIHFSFFLFISLNWQFMESIVLLFLIIFKKFHRPLIKCNNFKIVPKLLCFFFYTSVSPNVEDDSIIWLTDEENTHAIYLTAF